MTASRDPLRVLGIALVYAAIILGIAMGTRNAFSGLWLKPMSTDMGWGREVFSFAVALQNLVWGASQPYIGWLADTHGARRVLIVGALLYVAGLVWTAFPANSVTLAISGGVIMGLAVACTTYSVVYSVLGRITPADKRSWAFGIAAAAGSFGQFAMVPLAQWMITTTGWAHALVICALVTAIIAPFGLMLARLGEAAPKPAAAAKHVSAREALREAFGDRSYVLLTLGYFVCGFQVVFIGAHLTPYLLDKGMVAHVGVTALALVGLFNVFGTYLAGSLGQRYPKRYILSTIYFLRSVVIVIFLWLPLTPLTVYLFAAAIGFLWLSTVPPTNAIIAQVYGVRYMGMLGGITFFSHQIGSFLGAWLGGKLYDSTGSYDIVWGICIALGVFAALVHLPIDERAIGDRRKLAPSVA